MLEIVSSERNGGVDERDVSDDLEEELHFEKEELSREISASITRLFRVTSSV